MNLNTFITIRNAAEAARTAHINSPEHRAFDASDAAWRAASAASDAAWQVIERIIHPDEWHDAMREGATRGELATIERAASAAVPASLWAAHKAAEDACSAAWRCLYDANIALEGAASSAAYRAARKAAEEAGREMAHLLTRNADVRRAAVGQGLHLEVGRYWDGSVAWFEIR